MLRTPMEKPFRTSRVVSFCASVCYHPHIKNYLQNYVSLFTTCFRIQPQYHLQVTQIMFHSNSASDETVQVTGMVIVHLSSLVLCFISCSISFFWGTRNQRAPSGVCVKTPKHTCRWPDMTRKLPPACKGTSSSTQLRTFHCGGVLFGSSLPGKAALLDLATGICCVSLSKDAFRLTASLIGLSLLLVSRVSLPLDVE